MFDINTRGNPPLTPPNAVKGCDQQGIVPCGNTASKHWLAICSHLRPSAGIIDGYDEPVVADGEHGIATGRNDFV